MAFATKVVMPMELRGMSKLQIAVIDYLVL